MAAVGLVPAMADSDTYSKPGTLTAQAGVGLAWAYLGGVGLQAGADYGIAQVPFAPKLAMDFGASARVGFGTWGGLSAAVFGTAHYSWKELGLGIDWVNRLESYLGIGLAILPGLGLDAYSGTAYHLDKNLAIFVEGGYYSSVVGVSYRF